MKKVVLLAALGLSFGLSMTSCEKDNKGKEPVVIAENTLVQDVTKKLDEVKASDEVKTQIIAWATKAVELEKSAKEASKGGEGFLTDKKNRYVNSSGVEVIQLVAKGMIGAYQLQGYANEASVAMRAVDDAKKRRVHFEKAVTYLLGGMDFKKSDGSYKTVADYKKSDNSFGKYLTVISDKKGGKYEGIAKDLYTAIEEGLKITVDKGGNEFTQTLITIGDIANKVAAFRGVHYLAKYGDKIRQEGGFTGHNVHELSEGLGFIYSLRFAHNYKKENSFILSPEEANAVVNVNLWEEATKSPEESVLDKMAEKVAELFDFTVAEAKA